MSSEAHHDPVNALSEADATGTAAEIFAEIRETMEIPLVTSIWRTLAGIEGGLESAWAATCPLYESGGPQALLDKLGLEISLPLPDKSPEDLLKPISESERSDIYSIFKAYNRSNSLNLLALTALVSEAPPTDGALPPATRPAPWPHLPELLAKKQINESDWQILENIKHIGASFENPAIPTLWRHLIHWPELVDGIHESYLPLQASGAIDHAIEQVRQFAEKSASSISTFKGSTAEIPEDAMHMIRSYVGHLPSVSRMVTVGNSVTKWLEGYEG